MGLPFSFLPMMMRPSQRPSARLLTLPSPLALRFAIWTHLPFCFGNMTLYHRTPEYPAKDLQDTESYQLAYFVFLRNMVRAFSIISVTDIDNYPRIEYTVSDSENSFAVPPFHGSRRHNDLRITNGCCV